MPYVYNPSRRRIAEQHDPNRLQGQSANGLMRPVGGQVPGALGPSAQVLTTPGESAGTRDTGTGFIGFDQYMRANAGAGQQLANNVAGKVEGKAQEAQKAQSDLEGQFANQRGQDWLANKGTATYQNLSGMPDYAKASRSAMDAQQALNASASNSGREALLQDQYKYAQGGKSQLDAALLGAYGGKKLTDLRAKYGNLESALSGAVGRSQEMAYDPTRNRDPSFEGDSRGPASGYTSSTPPMSDVSSGDWRSKDPNSLSDDELNAAGYMYSQAPGESYAHYSDRVAARKHVG